MNVRYILIYAYSAKSVQNYCFFLTYANFFSYFSILSLKHNIILPK